MKRYIGVLLCITVLITCFVALPSLALTVSPQSMAIETTQAEIHHIGNGIMSCYSRVTLWQGYRANLEMTLQKKNSNGTWSDIASRQDYSSTKQIIVMNYNYQVNTKGKYRVRCVVFAYEGGSYVERIPFISSELTY